MWRFWLFAWIVVAGGFAVGQLLLAGNPKGSLLWLAVGAIVAGLIARPKIVRENGKWKAVR